MGSKSHYWLIAMKNILNPQKYSVQKYMDDYEKDIFRKKLAKWISWANYPIIPSNEESFEKHEAAEIKYYDYLKIHR